MGAIGLGLSYTPMIENGGGNQHVLGFMFGFIIGSVICSILMSTIASGVNAVIVLFAEAPAEFQQNYPDLSNRMLSTWREAFPGSV